MKEFDVIVIGAGPGGYVAAIRAAQLGLKTACIEKRAELGGTCLNVGCIPSKTLLHATEMYAHLVTDASKFGIESKDTSINFSQLMKRKGEVISSLNDGIKYLFKKNQVTHFIGHASFISSKELQVDNGLSPEILSAKHFIIATGSEPISLPFLPFDEKRILSSTGALSLEKVPKKMAVIGAGVIGVELGSVYSRLGSEVVFVEFLDKICPVVDESLSKALLDLLIKQGMQFHLSSKVEGAQVSEHDIKLKVTDANGAFELSADAILVSIGRRPYIQGLELDKAGVVVNQKGIISVTSSFQTNIPHIYAIGDVVDGPMLAHKASEEGVCVAEVIAGHSPKLNYLAIPSVIYTSPEVASVGLTEADIKKYGLQAKSSSFSFKANSRAKCTGEEEGFIKIIADNASQRILGVHMISSHASELIATAAIAVDKKLTTFDLADIPFAHPTLSECIKEAALSLCKKPIHR